MTDLKSLGATIRAWARPELERVTKLIFDESEERLAELWRELKLNVGSYSDESMAIAERTMGIVHQGDGAPKQITLYSSPGVMIYFHHDTVSEYMARGSENRLMSIANLAFMTQMRKDIPHTYQDSERITVRTFDSKTGYYLQNYTQYKEFLEKVVEIQITTETVMQTSRWYRNMIESVDSSSATKPKNGIASGISKLIEKARERKVDAAKVEDQIIIWQSQIENTITARTWGWEVEAPNPSTDTRVPAGVEAGSDGSVESWEAGHDDCECECSDCLYHECDCDNCSDSNDDPEHCNDEYCRSGNPTEYRTIGGLIRSQHPGLKELLDQIGESEKNETAGTHIHVYGADLEPQQIAVVLAGYAITQRVWDVIAGRDVDNDRRCKTYANVIPGDQISVTFKEGKLRHIGKFNAVNTHNLTSERGTLEFRQMNCNFNFDRITLFAWMARGLVEIARRGAKVNEFVGITDIEGFVKLYAKYGFTMVKETNEIENPMGSRYNKATKAMYTV
jgi:hypothetical protein